jgi:hypothetical protein
MTGERRAPRRTSLGPEGAHLRRSEVTLRNDAESRSRERSATRSSPSERDSSPTPIPERSSSETEDVRLTTTRSPDERGKRGRLPSLSR